MKAGQNKILLGAILKIYTISYPGESLRHDSLTVSGLTGFGMVEVISHQPNVGSQLISIRIAILRTIRLYSAEARFHIAGLQTRFWSYHALRLTLKPMGLLVSVLKCIVRKDFIREIGTEIVVTHKHIHALKQFLESGSEWALIAESDAIVLPDSHAKIQDLLNSKLFQMPDFPVYVNLAGGLVLDDLGVELAEWRELHLSSPTPPSSNTSCAYLINRLTAVRAENTLLLYPHLQLLGVDWMWNEVLHDGQVTTLHHIPPLLQHGSLQGMTESWNPRRRG